jgi:hypothetical protein
MGIGTDGATLEEAVTGIDYNFAAGAAAIGSFYIRIITDGSAGTHRASFRHATSPDGEWFLITGFDVFPVHTANPVAIIGDRCGTYSSTEGEAVNTHIVPAGAINAVNVGDSADVSNTYIYCNDTAKAALAALSPPGLIYPSMGNHDWDGSREDEWITYYGTAGYNAGKRSYTHRLGQIQFWHIDDTDADGSWGSASALEASTLGQWLKNGIQGSTAPWKVAILHHPPYNSNASVAAHQLPYATWGAQLVIAGHVHNVERIYRNEGADGGIYYLTNGRSGGSSHGIGTALAGTEYQSITPGFGILEADSSFLVYAYYGQTGNLLDRTRISQESSGLLTLELADGLALADTPTRAAGKVLADVPALLDARKCNGAKALAEALALGDTKTASLIGVLLKSVADAIAIQEARAWSATKALTETASVGDTRSLAGRKTVSDAMLLGDSKLASLLQGLSKAVADGLLLGESRLFTAARNISDALALGEGFSNAMASALAKAVADALLLGDTTSTLRASFIIQQVAEQLGLSETLVALAAVSVVLPALRFDDPAATLHAASKSSLH